MEANELRIGNWVHCEMYNGNKSVDIQFNFQEANYIHLFEPIKLTKDWLLRFGFVEYSNKRGASFHIIKNEIDLDIIFTVEHWTDVEETSKWKNHWHTTGLLNGNKLRFVHQLQNLYFARTGEELTIKQ